MNIQRAFKFATTGLGSLGLVLSIFENYRHFSVAIDENYWTVLAIAWALSVTAIWPDAAPKVILGPTSTYKKSLLYKVSKYKWIFAVTLVFLISGYYRWHTLTTSHPGKRPV